jgi:hypothetical protein
MEKLMGSVFIKHRRPPNTDALDSPSILAISTYATNPEAFIIFQEAQAQWAKRFKLRLRRQQRINEFKPSVDQQFLILSTLEENYTRGRRAVQMAIANALSTSYQDAGICLQWALKMNESPSQGIRRLD